MPNERVAWTNPSTSGTVRNRPVASASGTPTMGIPASCICCAMLSEPSPPIETSAVMPSFSMPVLVASINSFGNRRVLPCPIFAEN